jgi:hypothetical protein
VPHHPTWVWNQRAGSAASISRFVKPPDCRDFVFDAKGNPLRSRQTMEQTSARA